MKNVILVCTSIFLLVVAVVGLVIKFLLPDAMFDRYTRFNEPVTITCYSGLNNPVFTDHSTGMVQGMESGNGFYYRSSKTGKLVQLYMDCVITAD